MKVLLLIVCVTVAQGQLGNWNDYQMIWDDQFDFLDLNKWDHEVTATGGGNEEFQVYTDDPMNSYVNNGILYLKPTLLVDNINPQTGQPFGDEFLNSGILDLYAMYGRCTNSDNGGCYRTGANNDIPPTMSARLRTTQKFSFTYGRVRIRAQMPAGDWLWPAIWMLPEYWVYGGWPLSGEIDIIEIRGNEDYKYADWTTWAGYQEMGSTLHWGPDASQNRFYLTHGNQHNESVPFSRDFHILELDWSEDGLRWVVDDHEFLNVPSPLIPDNPSWTGFWDYGYPYNGYPNPGWNTLMAPFDQAFHFLMNVAVGSTGGMIPDDGVNRGGDPQYAKPWSNNDPYTTAFNKFYDRRDDWYWTWTKEGENVGMQVDWIEVYEKIA